MRGEGYCAKEIADIGSAPFKRFPYMTRLVDPLPSVK